MAISHRYLYWGKTLTSVLTPLWGAEGYEGMHIVFRKPFQYCSRKQTSLGITYNKIHIETPHPAILK